MNSKRAENELKSKHKFISFKKNRNDRKIKFNAVKYSASKIIAK